MSQPIAATEPIMPCPFCKGECRVSKVMTGHVGIRCAMCLYRSMQFRSESEAISAHNALCTAEQRGYERGVRECVDIVERGYPLTTLSAPPNNGGARYPLSSTHRTRRV